MNSTPGNRWKLLLLGLILSFILVEGYYIYLMQQEIKRRSDELKNISVKLQLLKKEREDLQADISSMKETGDAGNGTTSER